MSLSRSLLLIVLQALVVFVIGVGILGQQLLPDPDNPYAPSVGLVIVFAVTMPVTIALAYFGSCRKPRRTLEEVGWKWSGLGRSVTLGLAGAMVCLAAMVVGLILSGETVASLAARWLAQTPGERLVFLAIGLHAAFTEETLFRGNLFDSLRSNMSWLPALLLMAVIFALYHLQFHPLGLSMKFVFGVVFGLVRWRAGNLVAPALSHALVWILAGSL